MQRNVKKNTMTKHNNKTILYNNKGNAVTWSVKALTILPQSSNAVEVRTICSSFSLDLLRLVVHLKTIEVVSELNKAKKRKKWR